jgi:peptide/nickel transport system substrate-binding protein
MNDETSLSGLVARRVSRAQFFRLCAFGIAGSAASLVAASGAPAQPSGGSQPKEGAKPAAAGGELRLSHPGQIRNLDPLKLNSQDEAIVALNVYEGLVQMGHDFRVKPRLAESWSSSDDLKSWTFKLHRGVKFQHGRELDAEDVIFSLGRHLDPQSGSNSRSFIDMIENMEAVDKHTVKFTLKFPYSELVGNLTAASFVIVPRDRGDTLSKVPSGTGPFMLTEFMPGSVVRLERSPSYWDTPAKLDKVTLRLIQEAAVRVNSLKTGETDLMFFVPFEVVDQLKVPGIVVDEVPTGTWDPLVMDVRKPPFSDPRVRQAVRYALDKEQLIKVGLFGHGTRVAFPLSPLEPAYPKDVPMVPYDVEKAKALLTAAGYPNGFETPLYIGVGRPQRERLSVAAAEQLKAVGIRCNIQRLPLDKFFADVESKGEFYVTGWSANATVDAQIYPRFHSTGVWNVAHWKNPTADAILDKARQTASVDERRKLYTELGNILNEDGPFMYAWVATHINAWRDNVSGYKSHPMNYVFLREVAVKT